MNVSADTLIVVTLPGGAVGALTLAELTTARERAQQLGFGAAAQGAQAAGDPERWLTSQQLAALAGVADTKLESMAARGEIPSYRFGRNLRFLASEVKAALQMKREAQRANAGASRSTINSEAKHHGRANCAPRPG